LYYPNGIALDSTGNLYIADHYNHRVRKVNTLGIISTIAGNGTGGYNGDGLLATSAQLYYPIYVAVDPAGSVYVDDNSNVRIRKLVPAATGSPVPVLNNMTPSAAQVGGASFTITVNGSNFVAGASVQWTDRLVAPTS